MYTVLHIAIKIINLYECNRKYIMYYNIIKMHIIAIEIFQYYKIVC